MTTMIGRAVGGVLVLLLFTCVAVAAAELDLVVWAIPVLILAGLACGTALEPDGSWSMASTLGFAVYGGILSAAIETPLYGSISHIGENASAAALRTDRGWRVAVEFLAYRNLQPTRGPSTGRKLIAPVVPPGWRLGDPVPAWVIALVTPSTGEPPAEWRRPGLELLRAGPTTRTECSELI